MKIKQYVDSRLYNGYGNRRVVSMIIQKYEQAYDILQYFSKEDLIFFILYKIPYYISPIRKSRILSLKWERENKKWIEEYELLTYKLQIIDGKERDRIAELYNAEKDFNIKLELLKKLESYDKAFKKYFDKDKALNDRRKELDKLYELIDKAREEENVIK
jgi:hypothetical protein